MKKVPKKYKRQKKGPRRIDFKTGKNESEGKTIKGS